LLSEFFIAFFGGWLPTNTTILNDFLDSLSLF